MQRDGIRYGYAKTRGYRGLPVPPPDLLIALSHSGSSPEVSALLPHIIDLRKVKVIALTAKRDSALGKEAIRSGSGP